jgi:hypothetical protein
MYFIAPPLLTMVEYPVAARMDDLRADASRVVDEADGMVQVERLAPTATI